MRHTALVGSAAVAGEFFCSFYKGIPTRQAERVLDESIIDSSRQFDDVLPLHRLTAREPRCGLHNYNRPLMQRSMLRALMKDARGGSIR
ncbi:MAG: hypothetical protein QM702_05100 [Rubrivivax sp.]